MNETLNLKWNEVDLAQKTLTIMTSKNKEKRTLPLQECKDSTLPISWSKVYLCNKTCTVRHRPLQDQ